MRAFQAELTNTYYLLQNKKVIIALLATIGSLLGYLFLDMEFLRMAAQSGVFFILPLAYLDSFSDGASEGWDFFSNHMAVPSSIKVLVKYVVLSITTVAVSGLWVISPLFNGDYANIAHNIVVIHMIGAIFFVIMHAINVKKEGYGLTVLTISFVVTILAMNFIVGILYSVTGERHNHWMFVVMAVIYVVSLGVSIMFSRLHRGM